MVSLERLKVKPGELIYPKWLLLLRWARSRRFVPGAGITYRETPDGVLVRAKRSSSHRHPFKVGLSRDRFRIGAGTIDGESAAIGDRYLDGRDVKTGDPGPVPTVPVGKIPPGVKTTWVVIRRGKPAVVEHVTERDETAQPLALVHWVDGVGRVRQIVRHDLRSGMNGPDVFYWAV